MFITNDIKYIGVNDHQVDLFEGQYVVPNGMSYNSYVILDEKIAVMDTVDKRKTEEICDETVFLVLPRELMYIYHCRLTDGLKYFNPEKDEYGFPVGIGYIMPNMYPVNSES